MPRSVGTGILQTPRLAARVCPAHRPTVLLPRTHTTNTPAMSDVERATTPAPDGIDLVDPSRIFDVGALLARTATSTIYAAYNRASGACCFVWELLGWRAAARR